jgi:hypothetical protein
MTRDYNEMPVTSLDHTHARHNPWGLTPHQCCAMRLYCKYGNAKAVWAKDDLSIKTIQGHVMAARNKMGLRGHDVRAFLKWHQWYLDFNSDRAKLPHRYKVAA